MAIMLATASGLRAETYNWLHDITFDAPTDGTVLFNSRDRLEMVWHDMTFVVQIYSNKGINDELLKKNLQRRAADYNMYDTRTDKYKRNSFEGFYLTGTLPDGSRANIHNMLSSKTGLFIQVLVNYTTDSEKAAKKLIKSLKQEPAKKKKQVRKQKIQKKDAPQKPIKKSSTSPVELYEI